MISSTVYAEPFVTMTDEILNRINQYRSQHGRSTLHLNSTMSGAAQRHSQDMAMHIATVGHTGFEQRMKHIRTKISGTTSGAENVAYRYNTAKIVVEGWIHSPGHRRNILGNYTLTGIGIARDRAGDYYYTQLFANKNTGAHNLKSKRTRRLHIFS